MQAIRDFLKGKKTYLVAAGIVAYHVLGHYLYGQPYDVGGILQGVGLATLRAGITSGNLAAVTSVLVTLNQAKAQQSSKP